MPQLRNAANGRQSCSESGRCIMQLSESNKPPGKTSYPFLLYHVPVMSYIEQAHSSMIRQMMTDDLPKPVNSHALCAAIGASFDIVWDGARCAGHYLPVSRWKDSSPSVRRGWQHIWRRSPSQSSAAATWKSFCGCSRDARSAVWKWQATVK